MLLDFSLSLHAYLQTKNIHTCSSHAKRFVLFTQITLLVAHTGAEEADATDADRAEESGALWERRKWNENEDLRWREKTQNKSKGEEDINKREKVGGCVVKIDEMVIASCFLMAGLQGRRRTTRAAKPPHSSSNRYQQRSPPKTIVHDPFSELRANQ